MSLPVTIDLFLAINEDGDWAVTGEESDALSELAAKQGGYYAKVVKISVVMTLPKMTEVAVTVPDEDEGKTTVTAEGGASEDL